MMAHPLYGVSDTVFWSLAAGGQLRVVLNGRAGFPAMTRLAYLCPQRMVPSLIQ
jgi:hypothetical protein